MEISQSGRAVRVELSEEEMKAAGLCYERFGRGNAAAERFLAGLLKLLRERGLLPYGAEMLDVAVSGGDEGLTLEISQRSGNIAVEVFDSPLMLEDALRSLCPEGDIPCELWKFGGRYALISRSEEFPYSEEMRLLAAMIKEHGSRLSGSPFELI
ncbi:MAG: hypothetical protein IJ561_02475 [Ruminococcus sp.]|nr:hypothetical protein [Ruminococcus sp.]